MFKMNIAEIKDFCKHVAIRHRDSVFIRGTFGVGKSEGIRQLATELNAVLCDVRLGQYDSVDLRGFPCIDELTGQTVWAPVATLPFEGNPNFPKDQLIILFLDEITSASTAVFGVAYQLTNEKRIGEHKLMPNVVVVAAGNLASDKGIVNRMPEPLGNRFTHVEAGVDADNWCFWYQQQPNHSPIGIAFIQFRKPLLHTYDPSKPQPAVATPRTWEKALDYYADAEMPENIKQAAMAGAVGTGPAAEFWGFVDIWAKIIPIEQILKDPEGCAIPDEAGLCYATAINLSGSMTAANCAALCTYLHRMSAEYVVLAWKLAVARDAALLETNEFVAFSLKYKEVWR